MIVDLRTYTLKPGMVGAFLKRHEKEGLPFQRKHLGEPLGYFSTEAGTMNQVISLWSYRDFTDREIRRAALTADPAWQDYLDAVSREEWIIHLNVTIMKSTTFSQI